MDYGRNQDALRGRRQNTQGVETVPANTTTTPVRIVVYAGLTAAAYAVATIALAPISFGPLQLRFAGLLKPLALLSPVLGLGLSIGVGLANLTSPFGAYDFLAMPLVSYGAAMVAYQLRRWPWVAMVAQAAIVALGVAIFPLYFGGGIPIWPTVAMVFASEATLYLIGYALLRHTPLWTA